MREIPSEQEREAKPTLRQRLKAVWETNRISPLRYSESSHILASPFMPLMDKIFSIPFLDNLVGEGYERRARAQGKKFDEPNTVGGSMIEAWKTGKVQQPRKIK